MELNTTIHPADGMYSNRNPQEYFCVGKAAISVIRLALHGLALLAGQKKDDDVETILDLPCGYGRVSRMLRIEFPNADLVCSDIDRNAVDFCSREFNAIPVYSLDPISDTVIDKQFDIIWCGSLFTHLDSHRWAEFISFFLQHLKYNGVLVFTCHGRKSLDNLLKGKGGFHEDMQTPERKGYLSSSFYTKGFGYKDYSWSPGYGVSFSNCSWVSEFLCQFPSIRIMYSEHGWCDNHDVYMMYKANIS